MSSPGEQVSVVIPCYNSACYIGATLDSVLSQVPAEAVPAEVWVIDDGSTDDSAAVVQRYVERSAGVVRLIRQANAGESRARNVGISHATRPYVALLDSDDIWLPAKTAAQVAALEHDPQAIAVYCRLFEFTDHLDDRGRVESQRSMDDPDVEDLILYHYVTPSAAIIRREALHAVRFDEAVQHSEDMLFFADLRLLGRLRRVDEPLLAKREHARQQTKSPWHVLRSIEGRVNWCRSRADRLGPELAKRLEDRLAAMLIGSLEHRYWRRDLDDLDAMCRQAAALVPQAMARSFLAKRRLYPRWVYRLADTLRPPRRV